MRADWKSIPVPPRMQSLERDHRGFPVPFIVARDNAGKPVFTVNDSTLTMRCITENLCGICGGELEWGDLWWVGGPLSGFHPHGAFVDGPMHHECSTYALQVCPHLAAPKYTRRIDDRGRDIENTRFTVAMDPTVMPDRPEVFIQGCSISYDVSWPLSPDRHLYPRSGFYFDDAGQHQPARWEDYEVWRQGEMLSEEEGIIAIREALASMSKQTRQSSRLILPDQGLVL